MPNLRPAVTTAVLLWGRVGGEDQLWIRIQTAAQDVCSASQSEPKGTDTVTHERTLCYRQHIVLSSIHNTIVFLQLISNANFLTFFAIVNSKKPTKICIFHHFRINSTIIYTVYLFANSSELVRKLTNAGSVKSELKEGYQS